MKKSIIFVLSLCLLGATVGVAKVPSSSEKKTVKPPQGQQIAEKKQSNQKQIKFRGDVYTLETSAVRKDDEVIDKRCAEEYRIFYGGKRDSKHVDISVSFCKDGERLEFEDLNDAEHVTLVSEGKLTESGAETIRAYFLRKHNMIYAQREKLVKDGIIIIMPALQLDVEQITEQELLDIAEELNRLEMPTAEQIIKLVEEYEIK